MAGFERQIYFNELSVNHDVSSEDAAGVLRSYAHTIKALYQKGFKGVRYEHGAGALVFPNGVNIFSLEADPKMKPIYQYILTTARKPYLDPDSDAERQFVESAFEVSVQGEWVEGYGFTAAFLNDSIALSLATHRKWTDVCFNIRERDSNQEVGEVLNICSPEDADSEVLKGYIESRTPMELMVSMKAPEDKPFSIRDDHGQDKLKELWKRVRNSEYVESCINSLWFKRHGATFVDEVFEDGKIHLRLADTEEGFGIVIQTTGRNLRETQEIGRLLKEKYGR